MSVSDRDGWTDGPSVVSFVTLTSIDQ